MNVLIYGGIMMFREMRLKEQELDRATVDEILKRCTNGVLSLQGDNGYPYGVPISYAYTNGKIYFHCAKEGYKVDLMKADPHVAFTVVAQDDIIPEDFNTLFKCNGFRNSTPGRGTCGNA